jgi:hypothetical protein
MDKEVYYQEDVDQWVAENMEQDANSLFNSMLPKHSAKLDKLDKRIRDLLTEIQEVFPDACYYTASGGFMLVLGSTHSSDRKSEAQQQRSAWGGLASIGDGDW